MLLFKYFKLLDQNSRLEIIENTGHAYNDQMQSAIMMAANSF